MTGGLYKPVYAAALFVALAWLGLGPAGEAQARPHAEPTFALKKRVVFEPHGVVKTWRLRAVVRDYDRRFRPLDLRVGRCADHPQAGCVRVIEVRRPHGAFWGRWRYHGRFRGAIVLNVGYGAHRHVACHEIGHALGLAHTSRGCMRDGGQAKRATRAEMRALRLAYRTYCRRSILC